MRLLAVGVIGLAGLLWWLAQPGEPTAPPAPARERAVRNETVPRPAGLSWLVLTDHEVPLEERLQLAGQIHSSLSAREVEDLFSLLSFQPGDRDPSAWWVILNEVLEQMRKHGVGAEQYTDALSALIAEPGLHDVTKDYAVQQLTQWLAPALSEVSPGENDPRKRDEALRLLARVIVDQTYADGTIAGTALQALTDASTRLPADSTEPVWDELAPFLQKIISGQQSCGLPLRVAAIQSAALRGDERHRPVLRALAEDEQTEASVRLSSIAALGLFAQAQDRAFLENLALSQTRFQYAAKEALKKIPTP